MMQRSFHTLEKVQRKYFSFYRSTVFFLKNHILLLMEKKLCNMINISQNTLLKSKYIFKIYIYRLGSLYPEKIFLTVYLSLCITIIISNQNKLSAITSLFILSPSICRNPNRCVELKIKTDFNWLALQQVYLSTTGLLRELQHYLYH